MVLMMERISDLRALKYLKSRVMRTPRRIRARRSVRSTRTAEAPCAMAERASRSSSVSATDRVTITKSKTFQAASWPCQKSLQPSTSSFATISYSKSREIYPNAAIETMEKRFEAIKIMLKH